MKKLQKMSKPYLSLDPLGLSDDVEQTLLLHCAASLLSNEPLSRHRLTKLVEPLAIDKFIRLSERYALEFMVYEVLAAGLEKTHPLLIKLKAKVYQRLPEQIRLKGAALAIATALDKKNYPYLFLKGPALNEKLWGNKILRSSTDLDLLVAPADLLVASNVLEELGYQGKRAKWKLYFYKVFSKVSTNKETLYQHPKTGIKVDFHWKSHAHEFIFNQDLWLPPEKEVLYLCLHAAKHGWCKLLWLVDIIALIKKQEIEVASLRAMAKAHYLLPVVDEMLVLAEAWFDIDFKVQGKKDSVYWQGIKKKLEKRLAMGPIARGSSNLSKLKRHYYLNHFCSNAFRQWLLWAHIFLSSLLVRSWRNRMSQRKLRIAHSAK